jgi:hypothetical protein
VCALTVDDLFTAGIGFDIAGVLMLAKGLLVPASEQMKRNASGSGGYSFLSELHRYRADLKTAVPFAGHRGFESHPRRSSLLEDATYAAPRHRNGTSSDLPGTRR